MTATRILIVDDNPEITSALARGLSLHDYDPVIANNIATAVDLLGEDALGAAIVDVMIGEDSGLDLVRDMRSRGHTFPVLMLSALSEVEDRARGLEAGADDYIVKPFSFDELVARLKVQERRGLADRPAVLDPAGWTVSVDTRSVSLTQREFALLSLLAAHPGEPLPRHQIFGDLWEAEGASSENVVDVYVGYLRRKLDPTLDFGFEIKTVRNRGFMLAGKAPVLT